MINFTDRVTVGQTKQTAEGYMVATARVARVGVQHYLASELGDVALNAGFSPSDVVRLYRHPDEVFNKDSLASITRLPVTVGHPGEDVTADNWQRLAVGDVGDAYSTEAEWIVVNPMIKDSAAAAAARTTHREISMGYRAQIVKARDGIPADFEQKNIRYNHLALVPKGRAGAMARIGDSWGATPVEDSSSGIPPTLESKPGGHMSDALKTVVIGDEAVQVTLADVAKIEAFKAETQRKINDAQKEHTAAIALKDTTIGELRVQLQDAEAKVLSDADIDARVAARGALLDSIRTIDASIDTAGKSDNDLRRAAVASKFGDAMVKDASDAEINGMFKALSASGAASNPLQDALRQGVRPVAVGDQALQDAALNKANDDMNAWRNQA